MMACVPRCAWAIVTGRTLFMFSSSVLCRSGTVFVIRHAKSLAFVFVFADSIVCVL